MAEDIEVGFHGPGLESCKGLLLINSGRLVSWCLFFNGLCTSYVTSRTLYLLRWSSYFFSLAQNWSEKCQSRMTEKVSGTGFDGKCQFVLWSSFSQLCMLWNLSKNWKLSLSITVTCGLHVGETSILFGFFIIELSLSFAWLGCYTKCLPLQELLPSFSTPSKIISSLSEVYPAFLMDLLIGFLEVNKSHFIYGCWN